MVVSASANTENMDNETELLLAIGREQSQKAYAELFRLLTPRIKIGRAHV